MKIRINKKIAICIFAIFVFIFAFNKGIKAETATGTYSIEFNSNGGSGTMEKMTEIKIGEEKELTENTYTREGYRFLGWSETLYGGVKYIDKEKVKDLTMTDGETITLYAVWVRILNSQWELMSDRNIGARIQLSREGTNEGDKIWLKNSGYNYCFEHDPYCDPGEYAVQAYFTIDGNRATRYLSNDTRSSVRTVVSNSNLALAYILAHGSFGSGYGTPEKKSLRQRALWYYGNTWMSSVGNGLGFSWNVTGSKTIDNYSGETYTYKDLVSDAENYAAKGPITDTSVSFTSDSKTAYDDTCRAIIGPFKLNYGARMSINSISVKDTDNKVISASITGGVSFYSDAEGKNRIASTSIRDGQVFYIKNDTDTDVKSITVNVISTEKVYGLEAWILYDNDKANQRLLVADPYGYYERNSTQISIKINTGSLKINKTDKDTGEKLVAGFKIKTPKGWLRGNTNSFTYNNTFENASTYTVKDNRFNDGDGNILLNGIRCFKYQIYEVEPPNEPEQYYLEDQEGYDADNNWVDFGEVKVEADQVVTKYLTNVNKISISGYVWIDKQRTKENDTNSLWDNDEIRVPEVIVKLIDKSSNKVIATTKTQGPNGEYFFEKVVSRSKLKDHYIEFDYSSLEQFKDKYKDSTGRELTYIKYIPVAFNTVENGSKAIVNNMPEHEKDAVGIATTYIGTGDETKENSYGLAVCGNYNSETRILENINLGIKKIPETEYGISENLSYVKIGIRGYEYKYTYGEEGNTNSIAAPTVNWNGDSVYAYSRDIYPSDIVYRSEDSTQELNVNVTYRIDVTNKTNHNLEELYKEQGLYITSVINTYDTYRYKLVEDENWKLKDNTEGTAVYIGKAYEEGIKPNTSATTYITFSVNRKALEDILSNPNGIIEKKPTNVTSVGHHQYTRKDYSWQNSILKEQTHITLNYQQTAEAPYLKFKLGEDRIVSGKVFEDKVVSTNGEKLGDGVYGEGDEVIPGVKVELLDILVENNNEITDITKLPVSKVYPRKRIDQYGNNIDKIAINAETYTNKDGNYELNGLVPGKYYLRFTYGNGETKVTDLQGNEINAKSINAKDYKSTIVTDKKAKEALKGGTNLEWYKELESGNASVAIDNLSARKAVNEENKTSVMAGTAKLSITIENIGNNTNIFGGLNFGIIEQPKQDAEIEKLITNVKLTNSQGNVLYNGNPENVPSQTTVSISDLDNNQNGGSTYVRAEIIEDSIYGSNLELTYEVRIKNNSDINYYNEDYYKYGEKNPNKEVTLTPTDVRDYLDKTLEYDADKSDKIRIEEENENQLETIKVNGKDIKAQEFKLKGWKALYTNKNKEREEEKTKDKVTLVAYRKLSKDDDDMEITSRAEIKEIEHTPDPADTETSNEEKLEQIKVAPKEVHTNGMVKATLTITPPTGKNTNVNIMYAIAGIVSLIALSIGIVIIKKKIER